MVIDVSFDELNSSRQEITNFREGVSHMQRTLSGYISDSREHMKIAQDKVNSRITTWKSKIATLKERISTVKSKKESKEAELKSKEAELKQLESELRSCRPPQKVTREETDANGNTRTVTYVEDPDAQKRARLQAEISRVQREVSDLRREIEELARQLQMLQSDLETATAYVQKLETAKAKIAQAKAALEQVKSYVSSASDAACAEAERMTRAIDQMEQHLRAYDNFSYASAATRGEHASIRLPDLHRAAFVSSGYRAGAAAAATARPTRTYAPEEEKVKFPDKLRLLSEQDRKVEIVGPYENGAALAADVATARKLLGGHMTLCVKKPITDHTPCYATVKELHDALVAQGFHAKVTAMGTRYTDMHGYIYFIS